MGHPSGLWPHQYCPSEQQGGELHAQGFAALGLIVRLPAEQLFNPAQQPQAQGPQGINRGQALPQTLRPPGGLTRMGPQLGDQVAAPTHQSLVGGGRQHLPPDAFRQSAILVGKGPGAEHPPTPNGLQASPEGVGQ